MDPVVLLDESGQRFTVSPDEAPQALAQGFRTETPDEQHERVTQEKYGDTAGELKAGLAGAARGLTFGLSDVALTKSGMVAPETLAGLKEANPASSTVGEIGGAAAGLLVGPGALVAKGGAAVSKLAADALGTKLAARVVAKALGGAVEGSFYGLGPVISDSALGDSQLTAEKLLAGAGMGAVLGGGASAATEGFLGLAKKAFGSFDAQGLKDYAGDAAGSRGFKAIGGIQSDIKPFGSEGARDLGRRAVQEGFVKPGGSVRDVLEEATARKASAGEAIGAALASADEATGGEAFSMKAARQRITDDLVPKFGKNPARMKILTQVLEDSGVYGSDDAMGFAQANQMKSDIAENLYSKLDVPLKQRIARQVSGLLNDEIENQLKGAIGEDELGAFLKAKDQFGLATKIAKVAEKGVQRMAGNRAFSLTDYGVGGATGLLAGRPLGVATGFAGALGNKVARERMPSALAVGLNKLAESPMFDQMANAFAGFTKKAMQVEPAAFGAYGNVIAQALARSNQEALLTHAALSESDPKYRDAMTLQGLNYQEPANQTSRRLQTLALLSAQTGTVDQQIAKAVDAALDAKGFGNKLSVYGGLRHPLDQELPSITDKAKAFAARSAEIHDLATNPDKLSQKIQAAIGSVSEDAPGVSTALGATITGAVKFLHDTMPKPSTPISAVPALQMPWKPSDSELHSWDRYLQATTDPRSVLEDLAGGRITREGVESLQAVYPSLFSDAKQKALDALTNHSESLSYQQRLALGKFLQMPLHPSMDPMTVSQLQANLQAPQPSPAPRPRSRPMMVASQSQSMGQHMDARMSGSKPGQ